MSCILKQPCCYESNWGEENIFSIVAPAVMHPQTSQECGVGSSSSALASIQQKVMCKSNLEITVALNKWIVWSQLFYTVHAYYDWAFTFKFWTSQTWIVFCKRKKKRNKGKWMKEREGQSVRRSCWLVVASGWLVGKQFQLFNALTQLFLSAQPVAALLDGRELLVCGWRRLCGWIRVQNRCGGWQWYAALGWASLHVLGHHAN